MVVRVVEVTFSKAFFNQKLQAHLAIGLGHKHEIVNIGKVLGPANVSVDHRAHKPLAFVELKPINADLFWGRNHIC
jgi:hypothetical protein